MAAAREAQEAQLRLLSQEIKKRKRELENTRAQEKRRRRTEEALASQLLIYMWVAVGQVDDAVRMFRNSSSHPLAGQASEASLRCLMADLFWRADLEHILALMSREDSRLTNIRSEAYGLHAECLTAARVRELNLTCGVAPSSLAVCWMYDEFLEIKYFGLNAHLKRYSERFSLGKSTYIPRSSPNINKFQNQNKISDDLNNQKSKKDI